MDAAAPSLYGRRKGAIRIEIKGQETRRVGGRVLGGIENLPIERNEIASIDIPCNILPTDLVVDPKDQGGCLGSLPIHDRIDTGTNFNSHRILGDCKRGYGCVGSIAVLVGCVEEILAYAYIGVVEGLDEI